LINSITHASKVFGVSIEVTLINSITHASKVFGISVEVTLIDSITHASKVFGVSTKVTLIDSITHESKVFKNLNTILKDQKPQPISLAKPIDTIGEQHVDTTCEQPIDDLVTNVKYVVLGD
jgi:hypothetical protein